MPSDESHLVSCRSSRSRWSRAGLLVLDAGTAAYASLLLIGFARAEPLSSYLTVAAAALALPAIAWGAATDRWRAAAIAPALFWVALAWRGLPAWSDIALLTSWVAPAEALVLAATYVARRGVNWVRHLGGLLRYLAAAMLALFGAVHLVHADMIASLLTVGFPLRTVIPYGTAVLQLLLAAALAGPAWLGARAAGVAALLFASWLPMVHAPRLAADPSLGEGQFAIMALCLTGVMLALSSQLRRLDHRGGGHRAPG